MAKLVVTTVIKCKDFKDAFLMAKGHLLNVTALNTKEDELANKKQVCIETTERGYNVKRYFYIER